jgi:hypothetical protein
MLFNGRRQSKDRILRNHAREVAGSSLWMNGYTAKQFQEDGCDVIVDEEFLRNAPEDAWCFVENVDLKPYMDKISRVAVYYWNRLYPSDVKFPMADFASRWTLVSREEFAGSSHERITQEVYQL